MLSVECFFLCSPIAVLLRVSLLQKIHLGAQLRRRVFVRADDLHLDLPRAFGAVGLGRDFGGDAGAGFVGIRLGAEAAFLVRSPGFRLARKSWPTRGFGRWVQPQATN